MYFRENSHKWRNTKYYLQRFLSCFLYLTSEWPSFNCLSLSNARWKYDSQLRFVKISIKKSQSNRFQVTGIPWKKAESWCSKKTSWAPCILTFLCTFKQRLLLHFFKNIVKNKLVFTPIMLSISYITRILNCQQTTELANSWGRQERRSAGINTGWAVPSWEAWNDGRKLCIPW